LLLTIVGSTAWAAKPVAKKKPPKPHVTATKKDTELGGDHWRLVTDTGVVHVWTPPGYKADTAGIVVFVHGYGDTSDTAWKNFHLARQFKESRQNAIFIVPEASYSNDDGVHFDSLTVLLHEVWDHTRVKRPKATIVVIGHSGAFRTIVKWLDYTNVDHVILLDAMYAEESSFKNWLEVVKGHERNKLTMVGENTATKAEAFLRQFKVVVRRKKIPNRFSDFTKKERTARILYMRSQYTHMQIVLSGKVIPLLLRRTPLKPL
jgi:hypothetical protein